MRVLRFAATLALVVALAPSAAQPHARSLSYSRWVIEDAGATVELRLPRTDVGNAGIASDEAALVTYVTARLRLQRGGAPCRPTAAGVRGGSDQWIVLGWRVVCPDEGGAWGLESRLFVETLPQHLHFARLTAGGTDVEQVLQARDGVVEVVHAGASEPLGSPWAAFVRFVGVGVEHIGTGWDHLAFVLALLLLASSLREVVGLATGFTIAHSLTLALAVTGVVHPDQQSVEAMIAFSIALVAAENVWLVAGRPAAIPRGVVGAMLGLALAAGAGIGRVDPGVLLGFALFSACHFGLLGRLERPAQLRVAVAFAFGLVHGLGFAGVLSELALPPGRLGVALAGFNVGVELGQLAVIAVAWPLVRAAARAGRQRAVGEIGSAALCGLGVFWLVVRAFGR